MCDLCEYEDLLEQISDLPNLCVHACGHRHGAPPSGSDHRTGKAHIGLVADHRLLGQCLVSHFGYWKGFAG